MRVIAGKHMIPREAVTVLGKAAFHDTSLAKDVAFLSANAWMRDVAFTGYGIQMQADIPCRQVRDKEEEEEEEKFKEEDDVMPLLLATALASAALLYCGCVVCCLYCLDRSHNNPLCVFPSRLSPSYLSLPLSPSLSDALQRARRRPRPP